MKALTLLCALFVALSPLAGRTEGTWEPGQPACSKAEEGQRCIFAPREPGSSTAAGVEGAYRLAAGEPLWSERVTLGVALSGGGSKAAPIAMGVLAGLHDSGLLLPNRAANRETVVASVSGGGYAAYHLFTQLARGGPDKQALLDRAYRDCAGVHGQFFSTALARSVAQACSDAIDARHAEQSKLRCAQDLFQAGECSFAHRSSDAFQAGGRTALLLAPTLLSLAPHHFFNTLFDGAVRLSPSQEMYRIGIGLTYGSSAAFDESPTRHPDVLNCPDDSGQYNTGIPLRWSDVQEAERAGRPLRRADLRVPRTMHCTSFVAQREAPLENSEEARGSAHLLAHPLTFDELRGLQSGKAQVPFWVIQATAPRYRSLWGWMSGEHRDIPLDTFEFTAYGVGSTRYGFYTGTLPGLTALDATVSAAAFLDANQQAAPGGTAKTVLGLLQHGLNLSWGIDVPNPSVGELRRNVHRTLPFPLYWFDSPIATLAASAEERDRRRSAFIRVLDGGNADNTAVYSLYRRGIRTIVVADAAQDTDGKFADLCALRLALKGERRQLLLPGLAGFEAACDHKTKAYWDLFGAWPHELPALVGCITAAEKCGDDAQEVRLVVIKPRIEWNTGKPGPNGAQLAVGWDGHTGSRCVHAGRLYQAGATPAPCTMFGDGELCRKALPCDAASLLMNEDWNAPKRCGGFPQTSTVFTTVNSSGTLFAASRELSRHYTRLATEVIEDALRGGRGAFAAALVQQAEQPVAFSPSKCDDKSP